MLAAAAPAIAQQALPGSADPGRLEKRFEQPQLPQSTLDPVIPETPEQAPPPDAEEIKFTLTGILIEGATVYSQKDLDPLYGELLGKEVSLADIYRVAEKITAKYGNDGYALSRAVVPAQRISNGIVRLQIIEGYIDKIIIEGETGGASDLIWEYGEKVSASRPLMAEVLERYLLLANDLPGVKVESVLKASETNHGASNLVLVSKHKPVSASAVLDNRGSRSSGPHQQTFSLSGNSLTGLAEQTTLRYIRAGNNELRYIQFAHQEQIGTEGTKLNLTANRSRSTSGYNVKYLEAVRHRPVFLIVDEVQNYVSPSIVEILRESRKYGLHLVASTQFISDMARDMQDAFLSVTNVKITGKNSVGTLSVMAKETGAQIERLQALRQGVFSIKVDTAKPLTVTVPPPEMRETDLAHWERTRERQLERYYLPLERPEAAPEPAEPDRPKYEL